MHTFNCTLTYGKYLVSTPQFAVAFIIVYGVVIQACCELGLVTTVCFSINYYAYFQLYTAYAGYILFEL